MRGEGGGGVYYKDKRFDFITGVDKVDWPPQRFALVTRAIAPKISFSILLQWSVSQPPSE